VLIEYGYSSTDEFDLKVMAGVERGFFDEAQLKTAADDMATNLKFSDQGETFHEAWGNYHHSFDDDADAVLDGLDAAFRANANAITPINANGTVRLFKELGRAEQAKALAQHYVDIRNEPAEFWDLNDYAFKSDVTDPDLIAAFAQKHASFAPPALDAGDILMTTPWTYQACAGSFGGKPGTHSTAAFGTLNGKPAGYSGWVRTK
jgi:hypothetical protein